MAEVGIRALKQNASALVKLVVAERESAALRRWLARDGRHPVSSDLARTGLMRTVRRAVPDRAVLAREVLESVTLPQLPTEVFEIAGRLEPGTMRSLDALHLAAAGSRSSLRALADRPLHPGPAR